MLVSRAAVESARITAKPFFFKKASSNQADQEGDNGSTGRTNSELDNQVMGSISQ